MTLSEIWIPFEDETAEIELGQLTELWTAALTDLGFAFEPGVRFFRQTEGRLQFDLASLIRALSGGALELTGSAGAPVLRSSSTIKRIYVLSKLQWKVEAYLVDRGRELEPRAACIRSLALGMCQQALVMRLPPHTPETFAHWVMHPEKTPRGSRRTVRLLLEIQGERDRLSTAWKRYVRTRRTPADVMVLESDGSSWKGLPVFPGTVEGNYWVAPFPLPAPEAVPDDRAILIFQYASAETIRYFSRGRAVLFINGGVLAHACSIVREQGIPCVTALGTGLIGALQKQKPESIRVSAEDGTVTWNASPPRENPRPIHES